MSELYRVMKKGGWGILCSHENSLEKLTEDFTITDPKERQKHFGQYDHVRWYGMDYFERLKSVGFSVELISILKIFFRRTKKIRIKQKILPLAKVILNFTNCKF